MEDVMRDVTLGCEGRNEARGCDEMRGLDDGEGGKEAKDAMRRGT